MTTIADCSTSINASTTKVWSLFYDINGWPVWDKTLKSVESPQNIKTGDVIKMAFKNGPAMNFVVKKIDSEKELLFESKMGWIKTNFDYQISKEGKNTVARILVTAEGSLASVMAMMMKSMFTKNLTSELANLKDIAEK